MKIIRIKKISALLFVIALFSLIDRMQWAAS